MISSSLSLGKYIQPLHENQVSCGKRFTICTEPYVVFGCQVQVVNSDQERVVHDPEGLEYPAVPLNGDHEGVVSDRLQREAVR